MAEKIKEYEDVYFNMLKIINSCDTIPQLEMCSDNVKIFAKKKFKRDKPSKKEQGSMSRELTNAIRKKKDTIRRRIADKKKKENNNAKV